MSTKTLPVLILALFLSVSTLPAKAGVKVKNLKKEGAKEHQLDLAAQEIPIFKDRPDRPHQVLALIKGDDILTRKKDAVYHQMRRKALDEGADAITDLKCETIGAYVAQTCMGYAVKWK